ncbi:MAG: CoA transferase [Dehalococcoidales bacterium]|nr:CoA transferase [Dehalococcoidales bacterium]
MQQKTMLQGYRVLDLTDREAQLCGRMLADLGADVVRIEKPGGDDSRHTGPFYHDVVHPEKNLWWFALNANKKGITLNLTCSDGRELFKKLARSADIVIESFPPGYMTGLGLDYAALSKINPRVVMASLTPFGQTGPYKDFKSSELLLMALGVFMFVTGDPDRPPIKPNFPFASTCSAIHAASAITIALWHSHKTGMGQHIDVSAQAGVPWFTGNVGAWWQMNHIEVKRVGIHMARRPDLNTRFIWQCKDGYVIFQLFGGVVGIRSNKALAAWMAEEGFGDDNFKSTDWDHLNLYHAPQAVVSELESPIAEFLLTKPRSQLVEEATRRGILMGYVDTIGSLFANEHLSARQYWRDINHPELDKPIRYPGYFAKSTAAELDIKNRAPLIGEHNEAIYGEIGIAKERLLSLNQAGVI